MYFFKLLELLISQTITVGIFNQMNTLFHRRSTAPVMAAIFISVREPGSIYTTFL